MKTKTFAGRTLEEAKQKLAQWSEIHKTKIIVKEFPPVTTVARSGTYTPKSEGKPTSVHIRVDYEDDNGKENSVVS